MGICQSDPRMIPQDTQQGQEQIEKPVEVSAQPSPPVLDQEEIDAQNKAALKIQGGIRMKQAKKEAAEKKAELESDQPKDWTPYPGQFKQPTLPAKFTENVSKKLTNDRVFPPFVGPDGSVYDGQWSKGKQNGYGRMNKKNEIYYEGYWNDGQFANGGIYFPNGDYFIGTIKNGTKYYHNGVIYVGDALEGMPNGKGQETHQDGSTYEGLFKNGVKVGNGIAKFKDGSSYEGVYHEGQFDGQGTFRWPDGSFYFGQWKQSVMHGKGVLHNKDGSTYEGDFVEGKKEGKGIFKYTDKSQYEGGFHNNQRHGKGKIISADGNVIDCEYKNDQPVSAQ